ncbi:MAG: hypothetical protein A2017_21840 [Lentisphaerae bacterium GWF2_44_16]|nr:MAG: hypothetical protein A2017_21840 [Lentisphaerae bacterium GWF2_44_16]
MGKNKIESRCFGWRKCLFTLIELLMVVSIIMIMASLLLPALNKVRDTSKRIKCINNLKQVALYASMYSEAYNDYLLPTQAIYGGTNMKFPQLLVNLGITPPNSYTGQTPIMFYVCPSEKPGSISPHYDDPPSSWRGTHYGLSAYVCGRTITGGVYDRTLMKMNRVKIPSERIYGGDGKGNSYPDISATPGNLVMRHSNSGCVFYVDGHANARKSFALNASDYEWGYQATD